jgi:preprotein translocase subunit SecB
MSKGATKTFQIAQIYLLRAEFAYRTPNPLALPPESKVQEQSIQIYAAFDRLEPDNANTPPAAQVRLRVATDRDDRDAKALYDFDVEIAGLLYEVDREMPEHTLVRNTAWILFPFLRETVANLTMRGRFGTIWLRPMDMNSLLPIADAPQGEAEVARTDM